MLVWEATFDEIIQLSKHACVSFFPGKLPWEAVTVSTLTCITSWLEFRTAANVQEQLGHPNVGT